MRDALTLLDRAIAFCGNRIDEKTVGEMLGLTPEELIKQTLGALVQKDNTALHQVFETIKTEGFDANSFLKDIKNALGEAFYFSLGQGEEPFEGAQQMLQNVSPGFLAQLSRKINKIIEEVKFSDNALISAEVGMFTVMDSCLDVENLVRRLEALERGESVPSGSAGPGTPVKTVQPRPQVAAPSPKPKPMPAAAVPTPTAAPASEPEPQEELPPTLHQTLSNQQLWEKMLKYFEKSPFVYDVMLNGAVKFEDTKWTLCFSPEKAFYQIPAQSKIGELEEAAKNLGGRKIKIELSVAAETEPAAPVKKATRAKVKAATAPTQKAEILDEEPLAQGPFQGAPATSPDGAALEEVKEILDVIPGELLA